MTQTEQKSFLLPVILWIGAFICALYPLNDFQLELFAGAVLLLFAWMFTMLARDMDAGWRVSRSVVLSLAGAFWLLVICSAFWSDIKPISLTALCLFSAMPITFYGGVLGGTDTYFKKLIPPLAGIFLVLSFWAVFQFFFLNNYFHGQARHPLADPSSLGGLLSLVLFCALGWIVSDRPLKERKFATLLAVFLTCGIMATVARGPVFALVPGLAFFLVLLWPRVKAARKYFYIIVMAALAFYGLMETGIQKRYDLGQRLWGTVSLESSDVTNNRLDIWKSTAEMIKDHPLLGTGIGTYFLYYPEYRKTTEIDGVFLAHNDPLQFWAELGVLGPLLFYAFVAAAACRSFAALKNIPGESNERVLIASIFAALVATVAQAHVSFNFYNISILMIVGLLLSLWFRATGRALQEQENRIVMPENMPAGLNKALLVLPFLMTAWLFCSIVGGEIFANKARDALFAQDLNAFMEDVNKAGRVSMGMNFRTYLFAVNVPMAILQDRKSTLNEDQQKKLFDQVQGYMANVIALNPRCATAYYYMAKVQSLVDPSVLPDDIRPPEELYQKAVRLDPMHLGARMELLALYQEEGKSNEELIAFLEPASNFSYVTEQVMNYYVALTKLYLETKNYGKAREVMAKAAEFQKRSQYSLQRQNLSIPQAIMGGNDTLPQQ